MVLWVPVSACDGVLRERNGTIVLHASLKLESGFVHCDKYCSDRHIFFAALDDVADFT